MKYSDKFKQTIIDLADNELKRFQIPIYPINFSGDFVSESDWDLPSENDSIRLNWGFHEWYDVLYWQIECKEVRCVFFKDYHKCANNEQLMADIIACLILRRYHDYVMKKMDMCRNYKNQAELGIMNEKLIDIYDKIKSVNYYISRYYGISLEYAEKHLWHD